MNASDFLNEYRVFPRIIITAVIGAGVYCLWWAMGIEALSPAQAGLAGTVFAAIVGLAKFYFETGGQPKQ